MIKASNVTIANLNSNNIYEVNVIDIATRYYGTVEGLEIWIDENGNKYTII